MKSTATQLISSAAMRSAIIATVVVLVALAGHNQAWAQYDPGQSNLALGGTATSTRSDFGGTPDKGVDGNRDGNFGDGSVFYENADPTPGATSYFYQVDLGSNQYVNRIQFLPRTDTTQNVFGPINISVYADNGGVPGAVTYSQNFNTTHFGPEFATALPINSAANGRFVKLTRLDNSFWLTFAEMEVVGKSTPVTATNVALGKPATVFGTTAGFGSTVAAGNDGDINGDFGAANQGTTGNVGPPVFHTNDHNTTDNIYWQVDLGQDRPLSYANLMARMDTDTTHEFQVEVFDHNMNLVNTTIVANSDVTGTTPGYDHAIDLTGVTGEFVRVTVGPDVGDSYLAFSELQVFQKAAVWSGGGANNNWSTSGNFDMAVNSEYDLQFAGTTRLSSVNDSLSSVGSLTFNSGAGAFTLSGNALTISGAITNLSSNLQTVNMNLKLAGSLPFNAATANLLVNGNIDTNGKTLTTTGSSNTTLAGAVSGTGAVVKTGAGTLTLSGNNSYSGGTTVAGGTLVVGHVNALGTGALTINNGAEAVLQPGLTGPVQLSSLTILTTGGGMSSASANVSDSVTDQGAPLVGGAVQPVPEPSTVVLAAFGFAGVAAGFARRRKFRFTCAARCR